MYFQDTEETVVVKNRRLTDASAALELIRSRIDPLLKYYKVVGIDTYDYPRCIVVICEDDNLSTPDEDICVDYKKSSAEFKYLSEVLGCTSVRFPGYYWSK